MLWEWGTDGGHGAGPTTFYLRDARKSTLCVGHRVERPDRRAAYAASSTPLTASVGSLLVDAADGDPDAIHVETLKATLYAGATKQEFPEWDRTTTRPIDERFGFGEVNAYYSYKIQEGGQFEGSAALGGAPVGDLGWDYSDSLIGDSLGIICWDQTNLILNAITVLWLKKTKKSTSTKFQSRWCGI